jgi:hypothetical protein
MRLADSAPQDACQTSGLMHSFRFVDSRMVHVDVPPDRAFQPIHRIGGSTGWYYANWLWRLRGLLDELVGGPGIRRGRRDPENLKPGDFLDCWRVETLVPGRLLRLVAELRIPGRALLEFEVTPNGSGSCIRQTAMYDPGRLLGYFYWFSVYPFHELVFVGTIRGIARQVSVTTPRVHKLD